MSNDYCPPGLGKTLEDLIAKHTSANKPTTEYQSHMRHAAETRALLARMNGNLDRIAPTKPKATTKVLKGTLRDGKGREAYEWAVANKKSASAAARHFGINAILIHTHKRHYGLPPLVDGRIKGSESKRCRRKQDEFEAACRDAFEMNQSGMNPREAARRMGMSFVSLVRFCAANKLKLKT